MLLARSVNGSLDDVCLRNYVKGAVVEGTLEIKSSIDMYMVNSAGQPVLLDRCAPGAFSYIPDPAFLS